MSMRVDKPNKRRLTIPPRTPTTWIPDCRVHQCFDCSRDFTLFRRKHHCRACGRIFCSSCSSYRVTPPSYGGVIQEQQRMCAICTRRCREAVDTEWLVCALSITPVTFPELFLMRVLDKKWNTAINTLLSIYRGLQYKLPCQQYSKIETDFLQTHFREFGLHVPWQIHGLISSKGKINHHFTQPMATFKRLSCSQLLCSRTCHRKMSISNIIRLGITGTIQDQHIQKTVIHAWNQLQPGVHIRMMTWWVFLACKYQNLFKYGLIPLAKKRLDITYALWFECELQMTTVTAPLLKKVQHLLTHKTSVRLEIQKSQAFVHLLTKLAKEPDKYDVRTFFYTHKTVKLPWKSHVFVTAITQLKQLKSSSSPIVCNCTTSEGPIQLLVKNEDVRTDRLAMNISYWITEVTTDIVMPIYAVFPLNTTTGVVEMIPSSTTLYEVRKQSSLLNFVITNNPHATAGSLRQRIISSSAGACLLAFTMGLGDRHLENILITEAGYVVHVDFGYVFGDDPKHAATPMRITQDMVDAMGGKQSTAFQQFIQITQKGYADMRLHSSFWYHLLVSEFYIFKDQKRHWKRIKDHVLNRFVPGEWSSEASLQIQAVVEQAAEDSWLHILSDFSHSASNSLDQMLARN